MKKYNSLFEKTRSRFNIIIFLISCIHTATGCSKTPHTIPSPSPTPSTSSLPAPGVLTSTHSGLYGNLTHLLAEGLREDSSSQPRTAPRSEDFDLPPYVITPESDSESASESDSDAGSSYENPPSALPPYASTDLPAYVPTAVDPRRIEETPPEDTPIIRPSPPIREINIFPRSLRTIDLQSFLHGAQTLQAYFIPAAHQMIESQDFKLVVRRNAGRLNDSVTAPTVGQLKHIMQTQPQLILNLFQQIGITNLQEIRELFWTLPNSDTPFMRHDIGNYHAIIRVRKMYGIRNPLAEPPQGSLTRTLSRAESELENILLDHFIAYVTEGMLAQNLRLSENSKDWLRYDFRRFNRMDGSFEQNIIRLLDYIELSYFDRAIHPTDRTSPIPDEYFAVKNAIYAIVLEESFSRHLNLSLAGSPSRDMLDPNDQRDVTHYFYSALRDSFVRNRLI